MTFGSWKDVPVKDVSTTHGIAGASASETAGAVRIGGKDRRASRLTPYLFLLVPLAFLLVFTYIPVVNMFGYSLTSWDGLSPTKKFVGLDNYVEVVHPARALRRASSSALLRRRLGRPDGARALLRDDAELQVRFRNLFKGIIFFPYLINGVAIGFDLPVLLPARRHARHRAAAARRSATRRISGSATPTSSTLARRHLGLALHRPELRALPRRDPVDPGRALRGRRARRREPVAAVPATSSLPGIRPSSACRSSSRSRGRCRCSRSRSS